MLHSWIFFALLSAAFAALVAIFGKLGLGSVGTIDNTLATTVRSIIMAIFLIGVSLVFGKFKFISTINSKALYFIILSGIAGALSWLCYFFAIQLADKSLIPAVAALDRLSVIFVVIFAVLFLGDKFTPYSIIIGSILLTIGAILMTFK